jgi:hypothetical protein
MPGLQGRILLFLKKKKQKDFSPFGVWIGTNGEKFFGSFFQKRTRFLCLANQGTFDA